MAGPAERGAAGQIVGRVDEGHVAEGLGEVPEQLAGGGVVLLGQQPEVVADVEETFEERRRFVVPALEGKVVSQPERAGQEQALVAGEPVDFAQRPASVATHQAVDGELRLDGRHRTDDPLVRRGRNPTSGIMSRAASSSSEP